MHDVIQQVIATEAEAKRMVQTARSEAERVLSEARKHAQEMAAATRKEAQLETQEILSTAASQSGQEKQTRLAMVAAELDRQVCLDESSRQQVIAAVVRCVAG